MRSFSTAPHESLEIRVNESELKLVHRAANSASRQSEMCIEVSMSERTMSRRIDDKLIRLREKRTIFPSNVSQYKKEIM